VRKKRRIERKNKKIEILRGHAAKTTRRRSGSDTESVEEDSSIDEYSIS
jgi:hypothetical protein